MEYTYIKKHNEYGMYVPKIKGKKLFVHDNGDRPFVVIIASEILVFKSKYLKDEKAYYFDKLVLKIPKYKKIFIGKDKEYGFTGNSNLVMINDFEYIYIGGSIYKFKTKEVITKYVSEVGNSDVPYPFAVSASYYYLMIENVFYDKKQIPKDTHDMTRTYGNNIPYAFYYYYRKEFKKGKLIAKKLVSKMLVKRNF